MGFSFLFLPKILTFDSSTKNLNDFNLNDFEMSLFSALD
jgi:hypothetical protein